jgi:hypothetical protein
MNSPDTARFLETFIAVPVRPHITNLDLWHDYIGILRTKLSPLIRTLQEKKLISWYSFVLHQSGKSGVPTAPDDTGLDIHMRLELAPLVDENTLRGKLPDYCLKTQMMEGPHPHEISGIDAARMRDGEVANAWRVFGESSQWVLDMLDAHKPDERVPLEHIAQFLHLINYQVWAAVVGIPMP